jgi:hypothetical protein
MSESVTVQVPDRIEGSFIEINDSPFDVYVEMDECSRIFEINETNFGQDHPAYRKFTIDGGIPSEMLDDKLVEAISGKLGLHMQSICKIV